MFDKVKKDVLVELKDVPQSCTGAPLPFIMGNENHLFLGYLTALDDSNDAHNPETNRTSAVIYFKHPIEQTFGGPNDEALEGHPLFKNGLQPYNAYEVKDSSWIDKLDKRNSVHPNHIKGMFKSYRHFIFTFHDSTFECLAENIEIQSMDGSFKNVIGHVSNQLAGAKD